MKTSFTADALRIVGGTFLVQVLLFLTSPIITRLYGPESYGLYALFLSITSVLGALACLQYDDSIMLPESDDEAASLFNLCITITIAFSLISLPVIILLEPVLVDFLNAPQIGRYLPLLSLSIFLYGILLACTTWNSRQRKFGSLSIARVGGSTTNTAMQLSTGYAGFATSGSLIISSVIGSLITNVIMGVRIWRKDGELLRKNFVWGRLRNGFRRYRNFLIFDTWATLLSVLSWQLPILLFAAFFSPTNVGYYALGMTAVGIPSELIGSAVSQVFFQRASVARRSGTLPLVVESLVVRMFAIALLPFLMLTVIGPSLFGAIFGQTWTTAGIYAGILAPWILLVFITSPMGVLFSVLEKQRASLALSAIFFPIRTGALLVGGFLGDPFLALLLFSIASTATYAANIAVLLHWSQVSIRILLRDSRMTVLYASTFYLVTVSAAFILSLEPLYVLAISIFLVLCYYVLLLRKDDMMRMQVKGILTGIVERLAMKRSEDQ